MSSRHSISDARQALPQLVREAEAGRPVELTRHGKPVAVLIGRNDYDRLVADTPSFRDSFGAFSGTFDLQRLGIDPDELFGPARDRSGGREIDL